MDHTVAQLLGGQRLSHDGFLRSAIPLARLRGSDPGVSLIWGLGVFNAGNSPYLVLPHLFIRFYFIFLFFD